jgi:hypothetical protein
LSVDVVLAIYLRRRITGKKPSNGDKRRVRDSKHEKL